MNGKDFSRALQNYDQASALSPDFYELQNNRGLLLLAEKKYDQAIAHFEKSIAGQPTFAEAYYNASVAYAEAGLSEKSQEFHEKACSLDPQYIFKPVRAGADFMQGGGLTAPAEHREISSSLRSPGPIGEAGIDSNRRV
ncbi:MAG: tetratricopeptide repeat protein [Elusimicrobia bacterium]|nr:tetratricopeptide repeat protein [Elusimicrobiota bacterium]